jgi:drug/metabolite transporter (DMT)-like permease
VVVSSACFATLAVLARLAYAEGGRPLPLLTWRFAVAAAVMATFLALRQRSALVAGVRDIPRYALLSLTGYGAASICFFFALRHLSASVGTLLLYAYPAIVAVIESVLDHQRLPVSRVVAVALTFAGCALAAGLLDSAVVVNVPGVLLALGAASAYALFTLLSSRLIADRSRLVLMTYTFGISAIGIGVVTLLAGESLVPTGWTPQLWLILGLMVLLPTYAAVVLFLSGIRALGPSRASLISTMEPVFTVALAGVVLGERMTATQWAGALLVIAGIALAERPRGVVEVPAAV